MPRLAATVTLPTRAANGTRADCGFTGLAMDAGDRALSGHDVKAMAAGCDGYFAKLISLRVILAKVREFLT